MPLCQRQWFRVERVCATWEGVKDGNPDPPGKAGLARVAQRQSDLVNGDCALVRFRPRAHRQRQIIERPKMKRQPRKRLIRARAYSLIKAVGLSSVVLAKRSGYSHRQTLYALDGRRTCPERVAEVLRAMIGPDGWRYLCGEADSVTLTRTFEAGTDDEEEDED